jgi:TetR/AcrR family transcriptional regulator, regulator of autoinduction and epiphytic fitness
VLAAAGPPGHRDPWIDQLVQNGLRIGLIDPHPGTELTTLATAAVISAVDTWALQRNLEDAAASALILLLGRLWNIPR